LKPALTRIRELRGAFWGRIKVPGTGQEPNQSPEKAHRPLAYFEPPAPMFLAALHRPDALAGPCPPATVPHSRAHQASPSAAWPPPRAAAHTLRPCPPTPATGACLPDTAPGSSSTPTKT
ncbi:hypothetical protein VM98_34965, partial [Streptomyces rubellomurinus subsp. indigoferus]